MEFLQDDEVVEKEQPKESKECNHRIVSKVVDGIRYRYCKHCDMIAHADSKFSYPCGMEWCKCMQ